MMNEIWKPVRYYEGLYEISNYGRIKSIERVVADKNGKSKTIHEKYLFQHNNGRGYLFVNLWKDNKSKREYIHRLVALTFIDNPDNKPQVNHKDEDKQNNYVDNLEWCDCKYNNNYGTHNQRAAESFLNNGKNCYKVKQFSLEGEYIATYRSMREAERLNNLANGSLSAYFKNHCSQWGGYKWERA